MGKDQKKAMKKELGTMAGLVRMAEASAERAEARAAKAIADAKGARAFSDVLRKQAEDARTAAIADAKARHEK